MEQPILNFRPDVLKHFSFREKSISGRKFHNNKMIRFETTHTPRTSRKTPKKTSD